MESEIENDYIEQALTELIFDLGLKEFIDRQKLFSLIHSNKIKEAIKEIALYLGLPIEVNISYVPEGWRPSSTNGFQSTHLVKTDWRRGSTSGITAQVSIPSNLPLYGTAGMVNFPISVRVGENCAQNPATLISVLAHEFSHVLLYSIRHREKENEFWTDLTAMILGFADIIETGRKVVKTTSSTQHGFFSSSTTTHTETTTYGYLSNRNFYFAYNKIESSLKNINSTKKKFLKKVHQFNRQIKKQKKSHWYFIKYLEYVDKNLNQEISQKDGYKISALHQHGYIENVQVLIKKSETILETYFKFAKNLQVYTGRNMKILQQYEVQLKSDNEELGKNRFLLQQDVNILKKYVSLFYRLKLAFSVKQGPSRIK